MSALPACLLGTFSPDGEALHCKCPDKQGITRCQGGRAWHSTSHDQEDHREQRNESVPYEGCTRDDLNYN